MSVILILQIRSHVAICYLVPGLTDSGSNKMFYGTMKSFAKEVYPDTYSDELFEAKKGYVDSSRNIFGDLYGVYEDRAKYDLHWAFNDAARIFKEFSEHVPEQPDMVQPGPPEYNKYFGDMKNRVRKHIAATGRKYELLSFAVSFGRRQVLFPVSVN